MTTPVFKPPVNVVSRLLSDLPDDGPGLPSLRRALDENESICRELLTGRQAIMGDKLLSDLAKDQKICERGSMALAGAVKIFDNALAKADGDIEKLETEMAKNLPPLDEGVHSSEIRAHIKGLAETKRRQFVLDAQANDDAQTVAAVLSAPPYLSGLSDGDCAIVQDRRAKAAAAADPKLARQVETLKTARGRVELARKSLAAECRRAFGGTNSVAA